LSETDACEIDRKLLNFMKEEKPYLDNQLSLRQLAEDLEVNTNYLSQVINERHEKNFFEFINAYRVTELKEKLEDPQNRQFTILSLAFDCGFNSKTTFNTAFKRITGCTPSQYLKQIA
jgi:AraC-like DNA-binding protein